MKRFTAAFIFLFCSSILVISSVPVDAASGDNVPSTTLTGGLVETILHVYGGTISSDWASFPDLLAANYQLNPQWWQQLDVSLPIYIDWELPPINLGNCNAQCPDSPPPISVSPPQSLASQSWFQGKSQNFGVFEAFVNNPDGLYTQCAPGSDLEMPIVGTAPLNSQGDIRIKDIHGGIGEDTTIRLMAFNQTGSFTEIWLIVLRWNRPQTYTDIVTTLPVHASAGDVVVRPHDVFVNSGGCECGPFKISTSMKIVEWVSSDFSLASPGIVDASDMAKLASELGKPVTYGYDNSPGGPGVHNFEVNALPFGSAPTIDAGDLAVFAANLGQTCGLTKAGRNESAAILDWFGIGATGRQIAVGPGGDLITEYAILDSVKKTRAIADPYGYKRNLSAAQTESWGLVKQIYR